MRNLKRALSLGLTATMISGLMVMGSSAASYADVTSKQNEEAIEVLKTVGIMVGDENGKFNPEAKVTRNEMAVVMCNLLDYTVASYKGTSPFTDVPEWAEPYVAACYTNGITSGYDAKTYGGSDTVTTGQAALMLLKALGYFQYQSDFGADWQLSTVAQGNKIDLFDDVDSGVKEAMTRNDLAQLVLNALESGTVEADDDTIKFENGDTTVTAGKVKYNFITSGKDYAYAINDKLATDNNGEYSKGSIVELGEKLYSGDLTKEDGYDDFGRPATVWDYQAKEIGTFAEKADHTFTAKVTSKELYNEVGKTATDSYKWTVSFNGETVKYDGDKLNANKSDDDKDFFAKATGEKALTGNGVVTEVFVDGTDKTVDVAIIEYYAAEVLKVDEDDKTITLSDLDEGPALTTDEFDSTLFEEDEIVIYSYANGDIQDVYAAEKMEGEVTRVRAVTDDSNGDNFVVGGTTYKYNKTALANRLTTDNVDNDVVAYLDANGYVIYTDGTAGHNDYVYVAEIAPTGGAKADLEADAYFIDGTNKVVVVDNDDEIKDNTSFENKWYSYNEKSNGKYELEAITGEKNETYTVSADNQKIVENGKSSIYTGSTAAKANNDTIFVVNDDDDVTAYTGIKNVPDITSKTADVTVAVVNDGAYADVVYIYSADMSISGDSGDRVYLLEESPNASVDKDDNKYYEYDAIVNGEITTVKATDKNLKIGLYQNVSYDENGYMDDQDLVKDASDDDFKVYTGIKTISYKSGVLSLGSNDVVLADSYKIFVNDDGDGKTTTPSSLAKNFGVDGTYSENVFVFEDDNDEAVEVYVYKIKDADKNDADKVDAKIDHVQMWADGGFNIVMNQKAEQDTNFTVELQQRVDGKYVSAGTKKVTLKKDATTVSDDGDKFLLDTGSVYKVVVNGVESNEVKGA